MAGDELFDSEIRLLHEILLDGDLEAIDELRQTKLKDLITQNSADFLFHVASFFGDKCLYTSKRSLECYSKIADMVFKEKNPLDVLIMVLEEADSLLEHVNERYSYLRNFSTILLVITLPLIKLGSNRRNMLEWTLAIFEDYLKNIPTPEDHQVELDEKKIVVKDQYVRAVLLLCEKLLYFFESLVNDVLTERENLAVTKFGFNLLLEPAMYIYADKFQKLQDFYYNLVTLINRLLPGVHYIVESIEVGSVNMKESEALKFALSEEKSEINISNGSEIPGSSLAIYFYVIFFEEQFYSFPCIYNPVYLFTKLFYLAIILMKHTHNAVIRKGLLLCSKTFSFIREGSLPDQILENTMHKEFVKVVSQLSVYSYILENRKLAIELLRAFISKFNDHGRYLLFLNIPKEVDNDDINGEIITIFRKNLHENFLQNDLRFYQKGKQLIDFLNVSAHMNEGCNTDLIKSKNKIISLLGLFAFLFKRDQKNETSIQNYFDYFQTQYFSTLQDAIKKSRFDYEKESNELGDKKEDFDVILEGKQLPTLKRQEKLEALKQAFLGLLMIENSLKLVYEYGGRSFKI